MPVEDLEEALRILVVEKVVGLIDDAEEFVRNIKIKLEAVASKSRLQAVDKERGHASNCLLCMVYSR